MKVLIASDHAGFELKRNLVPFLTNSGFRVHDCGPDHFDHDDDYPDLVSKAAREVSNDPTSFGIVIGFSGQGEAIVANKFPNVRAVVFYGGSKHILTLSREHNDANILCLGAHFLTTQEAQEAVLLWLHTKFSNDERHVRRIKKINLLKIEN